MPVDDDRSLFIHNDFIASEAQSLILRTYENCYRRPLTFPTFRLDRRVFQENVDLSTRECRWEFLPYFVESSGAASADRE